MDNSSSGVEHSKQPSLVDWRGGAEEDQRGHPFGEKQPSEEHRQNAEEFRHPSLEDTSREVATTPNRKLWFDGVAGYGIIIQ